MRALSFPVKNSEKRESIETFFPRFNSDSKDSSIRTALNKHDYESLGNNQAQKWLSLDDKIIVMTQEIRLAKEEKERIWENELRNPLLDARKIVGIFNESNPLANSAYGFTPKPKKVKKVLTEKTIAKHLQRAASTANALNEAKAIAEAVKEAKANIQKSSAMASITMTA
jgi:hypothetical protein